MAVHKNFYETVKEAHIRLLSTIVLYEGDPYYVHAICNHKNDGIFRIYMEKTGISDRMGWGARGVPEFSDMPYNRESPEYGKYLDNWMDEHKSNCKLIRKQMDSPHFNKFRPFPLGMMNLGGNTFYVERQPARHTTQGLAPQHIFETKIDLDLTNKKTPMRGNITMGEAFYACIKGEHPSAKECLDALCCGQYENNAVAFHRDFAFAKGPLDMIFFAYKSDIVGVLPKCNLDILRIGRDYHHVREVVQELSLFDHIVS